MLDARNVDHVAICVPEMDAAIEAYSALLGIQPDHREVVESQNTDACLFSLGETSIELIAPHGNASLERFLQKRGPVAEASFWRTASRSMAAVLFSVWLIGGTPSN